ncbi:NO-inducible flavohemoprotein [Thioalkalivibrio sp. ALJ2]|uniref:NO-inducible flavohemoprotein n=1 Tax=Thioalkalivibrio sp. ALJ2 TaxID=1261622 RepID=UPI00036B1B4A|nr:NO-inducible flavohemoprotein [Thioalkalivibrio sp. ALJ2]
MLSDDHKAIIQKTVPILESGGEDLTRHFYSIMFRDYPEVRPLFNQAHQASGQQARALANAVLQYARHIDEMEALGPLVGQIVNKHVSLQVQPEHYPIVGECLLRAMRELLGEEIATDAVLEAWGAAYQQLADILIAAEEDAYQQAEAQAGGWRGLRSFVVRRKVPESEEITSFYLEPQDGGPAPPFQPGQYIGLKVDIDGEELRRNYSLSIPPGADGLRISVKREPEGRVSRFLHDRIQEADVLELTPPSGDFVLRESGRPLALISAGVGITPTMAMLEPALEAGRRVHFIHCARHGGVHAFREQVEARAREHDHLRPYFCYSEPGADDAADATGFLTQEKLAEWLPHRTEVDVYFLGPTPFMRQVRQQLRELGVPDERCFFEFFGPARALEA